VTYPGPMDLPPKIPARERYSSHALRSLLRYAWPHRLVLGIALALTLGSSGMALAQPLITEQIITRLTVGDGVRDLLLVLLAFVLFSLGLTALQTWLAERTAERIVLDMRRGLIRRLIRIAIPELDRQQPADLTTRLTSDSSMIQHAATSGAIKLIDGSLHLIIAVVIMGFLNLKLLAVSGVVLVLATMAILFVLPKIQAAVFRGQEAVGEMGAAVDRALGAIRTVKANGAEEREIERADRAAGRAYQSAIMSIRYQVLISVVSGVALQVSFLAVIGLGGVLVAQREMTVATLIAFLLYLFNLGTPMVALIEGAMSLHTGLGAMLRIRTVEQMAVESDEPSAGDEPDVSVPSVALRDVTFHYDGRTDTLRDVSFTVQPRTVTALVGPSGAGKTTLFSLIQRFYEPASGQIALGGVDIAGRTRAQVRRRIAYVEQDTPMLAGTLRENLLYAAPEVDDAAIADVLTRTLLRDLVESLPDGLDTDIGTRGLALSGGERQRIAIARALLREPQVLLLDEMTAHLDTRSEEKMLQVIGEVAKDCTVILIAHRISTVTMADQIIVMEKGRVRATGRHADLVSSDSLYGELVRNNLLVPNEKDLITLGGPAS
jgi:ABC-type multidrug transport system fused ATPase/permease subunit